MTAEERTYSISQLTQATGYSRRTIAYYVRLGLLPKVGQRGPSTRYPQHFLDRLLFLKELRRLQDTGRFPPMSLEEVRDRLLAAMSPEAIARVARREEKLMDVVAQDARWDETPGDFREMDPRAAKEALSKLRDTVDERRSLVSKMGEHTMMASIMGGDAMQAEVGKGEGELRDLVGRLAAEVAADRQKRGDKPGEWTTVEVTVDVILSVRSKKRGVVKLVEKVGRSLKKLIGQRG